MAKPRHFVVKTNDGDDLAGPYIKAPVGSTVTHTGSMHINGSVVIQEHGHFKNLDSAYVEYYINSSETGSVTANIWLKAAAVSTALEASQHFSHTSPNKATYTGSLAAKFHIVAAVSMEADDNQVVIDCAMAVNGAIHSSSIVRRFVATGADIGSAGLTNILQLNPGDYIELWYRANKNAGITLSYAAVTAVRL